MSDELKLQSDELNCEGLDCPQPVILTKRALDRKPRKLTVIVDNLAAKENVAKFAASNGYGVNIESDGSLFRLKLLANDVAAEEVSGTEAKTAETAAVIMIGRNTLGTGSEELGTVLMKSFFVSLQELPQRPRTIMLINSGVYLAVEESPVLAALQELSRQGTEVLVCGTCLDYFWLKEKLAVGNVTNMYSILAELVGPGRVITL